MDDVIKAVAYLIWTRKAVTMANRRWRSLHGGRAPVLMCRVGLHKYLIDWARTTGRCEGPPASGLQHVIRLFDLDPEAVKGAAREYYRIRTKGV